jgi:hypothetical protein
MPEGRAQLVQQGPSRLVTTEPRVALKLEGRDPLLVARQKEDAEEPQPQRDPSPVEDGARRDGGLIAAALALLEAAVRDRVASAVPAARTLEPVRPAVPPERLPARRLVRELLLELDQGLGEPHHFVLLRTRRRTAWQHVLSAPLEEQGVSCHPTLPPSVHRTNAQPPAGRDPIMPRPDGCQRVNLGLRSTRG